MKKKNLIRIIGALTGITSGSTRRAGSLCDTVHYQKFGFTLAEVLITLGIIGVVAAMTLPMLVQNYQKNVLKSQFKKAYSVIQEAWKKGETDLGLNPPACFYWVTNPYGSAKYTFDENGNTISITLPNGDPLPADYNGQFNDCTLIWNQMMKNLKVIKHCAKNARANGCIPDYKGLDTIKTTSNPDISDADLKKSMAGCANWSKSNIDNNYEAFVLNDGMTIFALMQGRTFAVDINGMKGPNKWGYDIFGFAPRGSLRQGIKFNSSSCSLVEDGGLTTTQMILSK